jgi:hypothetical protein
VNIAARAMIVDIGRRRNEDGGFDAAIVISFGKGEISI